MSTVKPPYDPVKTVEGMFNGSVTRIAYVMKDPLNYAQSTKAVLAETAKKFQDALDDCEIQLLDAKWYLERQLALNKERREAKAREENAAVSAKRKLDDIKDSQDKTQDSLQDHASKRVKTAEPEEPSQAVQAEQQPPATTAPTTSAPPITPKQLPKPLEKPAVPKPADKAQTQPAPPPAGTNRKPSLSKDIKAQSAVAPTKPKPQQKPPAPIQVPPPAPMSISEPLTTQSLTLEDYPRATPQDTPAGGNEDFNFVSMFGEPSGNEMIDGAGGDMGFDMGMGNEFDVDPTAAAAAQDSSLTSLLPGLESYANQSGDDNSFNLGGINMNGTQGIDTLDFGANSLQQQPQAPAVGANMSANDFGLPTLGPNEFDEFLNDNDMNFDAVDDGIMNMDNMESMDIDFDSMFK
ncbi:hypothetical protein LTR84_006974 [Exophiala bonariae]|uniref:Uncharacterized protein n=1 Tax=Exophiala bonariae TaxID=1690606 RepID=A0AAV9N309_9EURO|nr:hypothetical protein LTR84_006974 [Exophiala bonariae]